MPCPSRAPTTRSARWPTSSTWRPREFADKGLSGARIDEIAAATRTSKRMIYYYFGSKEGLYVAVLEEAYRRIRTHRGRAAPRRPAARGCAAQAGRLHVRLPAREPRFHPAGDDREHPSRRVPRAEQDDPAAQRAGRSRPCASVYERGVKAGVFRSGVDPVDLHMSISALCFFNVANRHTFALIFKRDLGLAARDRRAARQHHRNGGALRAQVAFTDKDCRFAWITGNPGSIKLTSSYIMA